MPAGYGELMSVAVPSDPSIVIRGLRRHEYERLVEDGVFDGEPVELLGGVLIEVSPQGSRHAWVVTRLGKLLAIALQGEYEVREEKPLALDDLSEPEPDIAVVEPTSPDTHPSTAAAVIEVAATTQALDLGEKAGRYAAAGVPIYWVVDLPARAVTVHRAPSAEGYGSVEVVQAGTVLELLGVEVDTATVFPPE